MDEEDKQKWLNRAEVIDAWRIIPKIITSVVMFMYAWFAYDSYMWIKEIAIASNNDLPTAVTAFVAGTLSALGVVLALVINKYFDGGRDWTKKKDEE